MSNELYHFGIKRRSGRYPYGSGERPYQDMEGKGLSAEEKAQRAAVRKEKVKNTAKAVGRVALKSVLMGATVAAKVVFSSAITSATLMGIAAVGYQTLTSPEVTSLMSHAMTKAGTWFFDRYVRQGVQMVDNDLDRYVKLGEYYLNSLDI